MPKHPKCEKERTEAMTAFLRGCISRGGEQLAEIESLRSERDNLRYHLQALLHAYRTGNSISTIREAEMREAAGLPK